MMGPVMYGPYGGGMWMFFNFFFWILLIAGVILLIVWLVRQSGKTARGHAEEYSLDILKKRYAKGEFNKEEYEANEKRHLIGGLSHGKQSF
jgi:putative membrane protein